MSIKLDVSIDGIADYLKGMISRANQIDGWLNRVAYPTLVAHQRQKWMTEGASEGKAWTPLNPTYRLRKLTRFRDYPGAGQKMLIATSRLVDSMTGDNKAEHFKLVSGRRLEFGSLVPYAKYVDQTRPITEMSDQTWDDLTDQLGKYLTGNK